MTDVIAGHVYRWSLRQVINTQVALNVWDTLAVGTFTGVPMVQVAEAYWDHIKADFRLLYPNDASAPLKALLWRDLSDASGALGEFSIPADEQTGTRVIGGASDYLASFLACGLRLTVGTRATRPGQKRLGGLVESDVTGNLITSTYLSAAALVGEELSENAVLGDPAIGVELQHVVTRLDATGAIVTHQPVTGYVVNTILTSQRSRRVGHGM